MNSVLGTPCVKTYILAYHQKENVTIYFSFLFDNRPKYKIKQRLIAIIQVTEIPLRTAGLCMNYPIKRVNLFRKSYMERKALRIKLK